MTSFVAECFWIGVADDDLHRLDERAATAVENVVLEGEEVRYLGSILMRAYEVVPCFFEARQARCGGSRSNGS